MPFISSLECPTGNQGTHSFQIYGGPKDGLPTYQICIAYPVDCNLCTRWGQLSCASCDTLVSVLVVGATQNGIVNRLGYKLCLKKNTFIGCKGFKVILDINFFGLQCNVSGTNLLFVFLKTKYQKKFHSS